MKPPLLWLLQQYKHSNTQYTHTQYTIQNTGRQELLAGLRDDELPVDERGGNSDDDDTAAEGTTWARVERKRKVRSLDFYSNLTNPYSPVWLTLPC